MGSPFVSCRVTLFVSQPRVRRRMTGVRADAPRESQAPPGRLDVGDSLRKFPDGSLTG